MLVVSVSLLHKQVLIWTEFPDFLFFSSSYFCLLNTSFIASFSWSLLQKNIMRMSPYLEAEVVGMDSSVWMWIILRCYQLLFIFSTLFFTIAKIKSIPHCNFICPFINCICCFMYSTWKCWQISGWRNSARNNIPLMLLTRELLANNYICNWSIQELYTDVCVYTGVN